MTDTASTEGTGTEAPNGTEKAGTEVETETPTVEDLLAQIDEWKGHARKHEDRAKANSAAAERLAEIEREKMTDAERAEADKAASTERLTTAERERDEAVATLARYKIAAEFSLSAEDVEALSAISDETALRSLAERLAGRSSGTRPNPAQGNRGGKASASTPGEAFADALSELFD